MSKEANKVLLKQLKNPFDPKFVKWRVGATTSDKTKGIALAYIDSREVKKRLDEVCGLAGWRDRLIAVDNGFISEIDIKIDNEWVTRSNAAGLTHIEPVKGGASDAFKRAASKWGIGHYLYYLPNVWVQIVPAGKSYALVEVPELPDWAKPASNIENWEDIAELELEASASADEQQIADTVIANIDKVRGATTSDELQKIVDGLTAEEQSALITIIDTKTKELIDEQSTTSSSNNN